MNINYVIKCVEVMKELSDSEKVELISFINANIDDIEVTDDFIEGGPYDIDYYEVFVTGPGEFTMHFSVGTVTDYLQLYEISDEYSLNTFNCKSHEDNEED